MHSKKSDLDHSVGFFYGEFRNTSPVPNEWLDSEQSSFKGRQATDFQAPIFKQIALAAELLLEPGSAVGASRSLYREPSTP